MDQPRIVLAPEAERGQERTQMGPLLRAALDGKTGGLVEDDQVVIPVDDGIAERPRGVGVRLWRGFGRGRIPGRRKGRHAHDLARADSRRGLHPPAIDADLALAAHLLDAPLADMRELLAKPAVEPLLGLVLSD